MYEVLDYHITYAIGVKSHHGTFKLKPILLLYINFLNQISFLFFWFFNGRYAKHVGIMVLNDFI